MARVKNTRAENGAGSAVLQRKDGRYYSNITVNGKLKTIYGNTPEEVKLKKRAAVAAIDNGTYLKPETMKLKKWLTIWLEEYCGGIKPGTLRAYKNSVNQHITPGIGELKLSQLTPIHIQTFINSLDRDGELSAKSIKNIHGVLHKALDQAVRIEYLRTNPADRTILPKVQREEILPLQRTEERDEIADFLAAIQGDSFEPIFYMALRTGMRLSEILGLSWQRIDFKKGTIRIDRQLSWKWKDNDNRDLVTTKNGKARVIKPAPMVMNRLKAERAAQIEKRLKAGTGWVNNLDLVFTYDDGSPIPQTTVEHRFRRICESIGVKKRFHDLRHTYATESIRLGIDLKTISATLGHYSVAFTMDVYAAYTEQAMNESANIWQAEIERQERQIKA